MAKRKRDDDDVTDVHGHGSSVILCRDVPDSFAAAQVLEQPGSPISVAGAQAEHKEMVVALRAAAAAVGATVLELAADEAHPDCCFVEDPVVMVGDTLLANRLGHATRRGEESALVELVQAHSLAKVVHMTDPGTLDGGDVLFTGKEFFVGQSSRTNADGIAQLAAAFPAYHVTTVVLPSGLHLKGFVTAVDDVLLIYDSDDGRAVARQIAAAAEARGDDAPTYSVLYVPDEVACNVIQVGTTVLIPQGFPESEKLLQDRFGSTHTLVPVPGRELNKGDGRLTCGSVIRLVSSTSSPPVDTAPAPSSPS